MFDYQWQEVKNYEYKITLNVMFIRVSKKSMNSNWYDDEIYKIRKVGKYMEKFGNIGNSGTIKMTNKLKLCIVQRHITIESFRSIH
jgi:hypothetical protein